MSRGGVAVAGLTEALETHQAAVAAKSDFLEEAVEVKAVADEIVAAGDEPTEEEIETAVGEAVDTALTTLNGANSSKYVSYDLTAASPAALTQMIADIEEDLAKELQDARDDIAEISGLQTALNALVSAHGRYVTAVDAEEEADLDAQGELAKLIARNAPNIDGSSFEAIADFGDLAEGDLVVNNGSAGELIVMGANGKLVAGADATGVDGLAALLSAAQEFVDASILLESREESLVAAANRVYDTEAEAESSTFATADAVIDGDNINATAFEQGDDLATGFLTAKQNVDAFASVLEDYQAVKQLADNLESLNDDLKAAVDAIEALDYELGEDVGTEADDLFVFTGDEMEIDLFGEVGNDLLFIGNEFSRGADLEAGDDSALEIFFTQNGDDTVITVEEAAFGSSASAAEVVEITLNGVNAEDLQFENGYVSVVEVA